MDMGIEGKTAIVCGSSRGLGRACAEALAAEGVNLVLCSRNFDRIFETSRAISERFGVNVIPISADISHPDSPDKLVHEALSHYGGVDILINNAGGPPPGRFDDFDDADWDAAYQLTFMSVVRMSRAVLPLMAKNHWGRIVNLASISVKQPIPGLLLSNAFRSAVVGLARTLADEAAPLGILVNTIATGSFDTDRLRGVYKKRAEETGTPEEEFLKTAEAAIPLGRIGRPEELAWLTTFLASERASYITGATIQVDGGAFRGLM